MIMQWFSAVLARAGEIGWTPMGQFGPDAQRTVATMALDLLGPYLSDAVNSGFLSRG